MGEPIKGHMTRVDRLRVQGQFIHSVQNKSIQVFGNTLTSLLFYEEKLQGVYYYKIYKIEKIHCSLYKAMTRVHNKNLLLNSTSVFGG